MSYNPKKPKTPKTPTVIKPADPEPKPEPVVNEPEPIIEEPEPVIVDPVIEEPEPEIIEEETTIVEKRNVVVCLDNGHGSDTPGKCSPWSACKVPPEIPFREYEYCRDIVRRLAPILEKEGFT